MSNSTSRQGSRTGSGGASHLEVVPYRAHRSRKVQFLLLLWRWLFELAFGALCIAFIVRLHRNGLPVVWAVVSVLAAIGFPLLIPRTRHVLVAFFFTLVTRHRLRAFFVECRVFNRSGKLPWILTCRPTSVGERCWVWLVPGLSIHDFENEAEEIATACWARTARVERHKSIASLVRLDVVRRDPLTTGGVLPSTLIPAHGRRPSHQDQDTTAAPLNLPRQVINLTTADQLGAKERDGKASKVNSRRPRTTTPVDDSQSPTTPVTPAVVSRGGEDVSDYV